MTEKKKKREDKGSRLIQKPKKEPKKPDKDWNKPNINELKKNTTKLIKWDTNLPEKNNKNYKQKHPSTDWEKNQQNQ